MELQFEFLLNLSYKDIIGYCQLNKDVLSICESETFWKMKLDREGHDSDLLDTIIGPTPAVKYQIFSDINNADNQLSETIRQGQAQFLEIIWRPEDVYDVFPDDIVNAIYNGHKNIVEPIIDLIRNRSILDPTSAEDLITYIINASLTPAIESGLVDEIIYLRKFADVNYLYLLKRINEYYLMNMAPKLYNEIISSAKDDEEPGIVQKFAEYLILQNKNIDLDYILQHYRNDLDLSGLFHISLNLCPIAQKLNRIMNM